MINKWIENIPTEWLVGAWDWDWGWIDKSGNWNDGSANDVTYDIATKGYVKKVGVFNNSSSNVVISNVTWMQWDDINIVMNFKATSWRWHLFAKADDWWNWYKTDFLIRWGSSDWDGKILFQMWNWSDYLVNVASSVTYVQNKIYSINLILNTWNYSIKIDWIEILSWTYNNSNRYIWDWTQWFYIWKRGDTYEYFWWQLWLIRIYNRILTENERFALQQEALRKLWSPLALQWPELFEWAVAYYDFRNNNLSNLIDWNNATNNGTTAVTDHLGNSNSARSFNWSSNSIWTNISLSSWFSLHIKMKFNNLNSNEYIYDDWQDTTDRYLIYYNQSNDILVAYCWQTAIWNVDNFSTKITIWEIFDFTITSESWNTSYYINGVLDSTHTTTYNWVWTELTFWKRFNWQDYLNWVIYSVIIFHKIISLDKIKLLNNITSKKYIYPFPKYSASSLPRPILHIDWTNDGSTWYDQSWNWNNWIQSGWVWSWRIGQSSYMSFDWSDDYIDTWYKILWADSTVIFSYTHSSQDSQKYILSQWYNWWANWRCWIDITTANKMELFQNPSAPFIQSPLTLVTWKTYRVVWTRKNTTDWELFINNASQWTATNWITMPNETLLFMKLSSDYKSWKITDIKIFEEHLSNLQIQQDFYSNYI